jgi:hypothetical protein
MATRTNQKVMQFKASAPDILKWKGQQDWQKPRYEVRYFHRRKIEVWSGYVRTKDIKGWVGNVRIDLFVKKWARDHNGSEPTNDDILQWMIRDQNVLADGHEFELSSLAESIVNNGVRQPVVITSEGTLLDGNRRYFAALMKLQEGEAVGDRTTIAMVTHLPAYVLSPACSAEDLEAVLVEENFVDACRREWPKFIKATRVYKGYQELREEGLSRPAAIAELVERFGGKGFSGKNKSQIQRWIKMMDFIEEFNEYHSSEDEETGRKPKDEYDIKWKSQEYFEYFDELTKTNVLKVLESDSEFRARVFEHLYDDDFISFVEIRKLPSIALDRKARDSFMSDAGRDAVKGALDWLAMTGIAKKAIDLNDRILGFKRFLESLTAQEMSTLNLVTVKELQVIAEMLAAMAAAAKGKKN